MRGRILIADVPEATERLRRALSASYELEYAELYGKAISLLRDRDYDLLICGQHFDDSKMFDLMGAVRTELKLMNLPMMCFRHLHTTTFSDDVQKGVQMTAELLGACKFIDEAYQLNDEDILEAVDGCIATKAPDS
jgi:hypothetical protein